MNKYILIVTLLLIFTGCQADTEELTNKLTQEIIQKNKMIEKLKSEIESLKDNSSEDSLLTEDHEKFHSFLWGFFNNTEFQINRIIFPIEVHYLDYDDNAMDIVLKTRNVEQKDWKYLSGPDHYRCKQNCFDLVIYDNHGRKFHGYNERVLSYEGVENGISFHLFFILKDGKWFVTKMEDAST